MTRKDILQRIESIKQIKDNDERAHSAEDRLRADVLLEISRGHMDAGDMAELASLALSTSEIDFCRWCA